MSKLEYTLNKGEDACSVRKFLSLLVTNDHLKEMIVTNFKKLESVLAGAECELTRQLKVNYDLFEVSDVWCFSLSQRTFVHNPITEIGKEIPRAFVPYSHDKEPDAKYFK